MGNFTHKPVVRGFPSFSALALAIAAGTAMSAERPDLHAQDVQAINQQYAKVIATIGAAAEGASRHAEMLGLEASSSLRQLEKSIDADGTTHYRYQQLYRGIPVFGEHVVVIGKTPRQPRQRARVEPALAVVQPQRLAVQHGEPHESRLGVVRHGGGECCRLAGQRGRESHRAKPLEIEVKHDGSLNL